eukprot:CAMPEP_0116131964 /NCGR_PEP_ID=MMETSP0329-20121206/9294_1 /TAXON_ID=697910 /ORGANISM="Pseudo-nitzschia arenysensis, Strain B593" /LENGTH=665 /DNA_ID=CAMNT_0003626445 /DNA_START=172 /DNA_END=2169 /DNA_ORIENTATION=-
MSRGVSVTDEMIAQVEMEVPKNKDEMKDRESKLRWINRLLNSENSSGNNYKNENNAFLCAKTEKSSSEAGVFVVADQELQEGTMVLSCESEGFVLETPELRRNYCSYCGCKKNEKAPLMFCLNCLDSDGNPMIGYCSGCTHAHKRHHIDNPVECRVIQCLRATITNNENSNGEEDEETAITNQVLGEIFASSVAILAIKLLARQTHIQRSEHETSWWEKIKLLYENPLPAQGPYSAIAMLLGAALDAAVDTNTMNSCEQSHEILARSTLGRILGCSHAIVDPSLPLGKQTLGRAIYAGHSFYNHSCSPNAYLSTNLPSASKPSSNNGDGVSVSPQRLTARVHLLRPVSKGEEITVSYLPLSGLSRQERKETLETSYGFSCNCSVCSDNNHPLVLPPNTDVAGIDSIRQIQFGLNDKLTDLSAKMIKDFRYSIIRREHERIRNRSFRNRNESKDEEEENENKPNSAFVLELDRILRTIEMTQKGISNQNLPECHEVSIESERLSAAACDLWLKVMGESLCVSSESAFDAHFEFWRKTDQIQGLFDPVALGTQCLASSLSCILRSHEKQKKRDQERQKKHEEGKDGDNENKNGDDNNDNNDDDDINDEIQLSKAERKRGLKLLTTCLGSDHPWVKKLESDTTSSTDLEIRKRHDKERKRKRARRRYI